MRQRVTREPVFFVSFTVEGERSFPVDMLRYDHCYPARGEDAVEIAASLHALGMGRARRVKLRQWQFHEGSSATHEVKAPSERWASYGWRVIDGPHAS